MDKYSVWRRSMNDISRYERLTREFLYPYQKELLEAMVQHPMPYGLYHPYYKEKEPDYWNEVKELFEEEL